LIAAPKDEEPDVRRWAAGASVEIKDTPIKSLLDTMELEIATAIGLNF
jgi:hypothetical protein